MIRLLALTLLLPSVASAQWLFDWMGEPAKVVQQSSVDVTADLKTELEALRPKGYAFYIVAVCTEAELAAWPNRDELRAKNWGVVRKEPKTRRATSFVVTRDRVTALQNLATNADLNRIVAKLAPREASSQPTITMFTRKPCVWCDRWEATERRKAEAAGYLVEVVAEPDNSKLVPRFQVCGADGYCRDFSGFTTFESMLR